MSGTALNIVRATTVVAQLWHPLKNFHAAFKVSDCGRSQNREDIQYIPSTYSIHIFFAVLQTLAPNVNSFYFFMEQKNYRAVFI